MERKNILDILNNSKGYKYALFTSFSFDADFFDNNILNILESHQVNSISVIIDSKEFYKKMKDYSESSIWTKYSLDTVTTNCSFHSKIILLLGKEKARLIVTSANLTYNGYEINNEIMNCFEYNKEHIEEINIIQNAFQYIYNISKINNLMDLETLNNIYYEYEYLKTKYVVEEDTWLIDNFNDSVINKINKIIDREKVNKIKIAVPFYDKDLTALKRIIDEYKKSTIQLYVQNELSTFQFDKNVKDNIIEKDNLKIFNNFKEIGTSSMYHGKVYCFDTDSSSYILYGSSNCSNAALFNSSQKDGNYECNVLSKGQKNAFDYYFNNFIIVDEPTPKNRNFEFNKEIKEDYYFVFHNDEHNLHFKFLNKYEVLIIKYKDTELSYKYDENQLIIEKIENMEAGVIELEFLYNEEKHIYKAINIKFDHLNMYRNKKQITDEIPQNIFDNMKNEKYIEGYKMLLNLIPYTSENVNKENNDRATIYDAENNDETSEYKEIDEYEVIAGYDIPLNFKKNEYESRDNNIRKIVNSFYNIIVDRKQKKGTGTGNDGLGRKRRGPLSEEVRFKSLIKRKLREANEEEYFNILNHNSYINNILVLMNVILNYNNEAEVELFDLTEYIQYIRNFLERMIHVDIEKLSIDEKDIKIDQEIIKHILFVYVILLLTEKENIAKNEANARNILREYNLKNNLRDNYLDYYKGARVFVERDANDEYMKKNIYEALNYLTIDEMIELLKQKTNGEVTYDDNTYIIDVKTDHIIDYYVTDSGISKNISDIKNVVKTNYEKLKEGYKLDITIKNTSNTNIESKEYIIDIRSGIIKRYTNGIENKDVRCLN